MVSQQKHRPLLQRNELVQQKRTIDKNAPCAEKLHRGYCYVKRELHVKLMESEILAMKESRKKKREIADYREGQSGK